MLKNTYTLNMGIFDKIDIDYVIKELSKQTNPKKIERVRELLRKNNLTDEDIDLRLALVEDASDKPNLGYTKGSGSFASTAYTLECNHSIRAKTTSLTKSLSYLIGRTVYCEVCKDNRTVTGRPVTQS